MNRILVHPFIRTGLGLATNSFLPSLRRGEITLEQLLRWAAENGFSWIELRDPHVEMKTEELDSVRKLADELRLRVHYAWDNPDLTHRENSFLTGINNASRFGEGTCCRVVLAPCAIQGKKRYDEQDFKAICCNAAEYSKIAEGKGVRLCFENSKEPVTEMGKILHCAEIYTTLDAANFTAETTQENPDELELLEYFRTNRKKISYFHLKTTREHQVLNSIEAQGDFDVFKILDELAENPEVLVCLELPPQKHLKEMQNQVYQSLKVLQNRRKDK